MKNSLPALLALLVATCALGVTLFRTAEPAPVAAPMTDTPSPANDELALRVARIEENITKLGETVESMRLTVPSSREVVPSGEVAEASATVDQAVVDARFAELEREIRELKRSRASSSVPAAVASRTDEDRRKVVEGWTRMTQDPAATEAQRLEGLRELRRSRLIDGTDARLNVLPDVVRLGEQSQDPRVRADVWRQLHGVADRSILQPLLNALQNDPSDEVRAEAAESLDAFLSDPVARTALEYASEHDASPKVRSQALQSLQPRR